MMTNLISYYFKRYTGGLSFDVRIQWRDASSILLNFEIDFMKNHYQ
jgi:hypothetical protein